MSKCSKLLEKAREAPNSIRFDELCSLAECYGFTFKRKTGSHHIYKRPGYYKTFSFPERSGNVLRAYVDDLLDTIDELGE
ncbi:MAG: type II toxin-antitoxin system HicA family toxin [Acidobacteria bacterium]|nr:type II toxin-antitoxin system HicA family toxin [Acidobacteriota bacterium]